MVQELNSSSWLGARRREHDVLKAGFGDEISRMECRGPVHLHVVDTRTCASHAESQPVSFRDDLSARREVGRALSEL